MAVYHQSDVSAWDWCPALYNYQRRGVANRTNSAMAYGSVAHHAVTVFERLKATGTPRQQALQSALETFVYYWRPQNIQAICDAVPEDGWLPHQTYSGLRERGIDMLREYAEFTKFDDSELLATEYSFMVPIDGTWDYELGEPHHLAGSIDRLDTNKWHGFPVLNVRDYKTGREYRFLRQNLQGSAYCLATTKREFWVGYRGEDGFGEERGEELFQRFAATARRFTWINLKEIKFQDGGWRGPKDYARFALAVEQIHASIQADIYPLNLSGQTCQYCQARKVCGGTGVPEDDHGRPGIAV